MNSNQLGKRGEQLFEQIMKNRGYILQNVSSNPLYWEKDIDFIATSPTSGSTKTFEVKFDSKINKTGNLYLELTNVHSKNGIGWFNFCQADFLAYGNSVKNKFYVIELQELRERIKKLSLRIANCGQDSCGYLLNINQIADLIKELA